MGSLLVVLPAPLLDDLTRVLDTEKLVLVEALVEKLAVEALDEGIVFRLARAIEVQLEFGPELVECFAKEAEALFEEMLGLMYS